MGLNYPWITKHIMKHNIPHWYCFLRLPLNEENHKNLGIFKTFTFTFPILPIVNIVKVVNNSVKSKKIESPIQSYGDSSVLLFLLTLRFYLHDFLDVYNFYKIVDFNEIFSYDFYSLTVISHDIFKYFTVIKSSLCKIKYFGKINNIYYENISKGLFKLSQYQLFRAIQNQSIYFPNHINICLLFIISGLGITVVLSYSIIMLIVNDVTPRTGVNIPVLRK